MKIEKLTENKIRVIVNSSDFKLESLDIHLLMTKAFENQNFFTNMLEQAKQTVGFNTDGCKLLIETFSSGDDVLIFTITKYSTQNINSSEMSRKKLIVKRKTLNLSNNQYFYRFNAFDEFCDFCEYISKISNSNIKNFYKNTSLFLYKNIYYLLVKHIDTLHYEFNFLYSMTSEFSTPLPCSNNFENKLIEHGKIIMKRNAILTGIKYFVYK